MLKKLSLLIVLFLITFSHMKKLPYVTGIITSIELVEIPNKAINKQNRFETRIRLDILSAYDHKGKLIPAESYDYPVFAGDSCLIDKFDVDRKVKIVCSSKTGRHIESIEIIE